MNNSFTIPNIQKHQYQLEDSESKRPECESKRSYTTVGEDKRLDLIDLLQKESITIKEAAERININYSSAKQILKAFKQKGHIKTKKMIQKERLREKEAIFEKYFRLLAADQAKVASQPDDIVGNVQIDRATQNYLSRQVPVPTKSLTEERIKQENLVSFIESTHEFKQENKNAVFNIVKESFMAPVPIKLLPKKILDGTNFSDQSSTEGSYTLADFFDFNYYSLNIVKDLEDRPKLVGILNRRKYRESGYLLEDWPMDKMRSVKGSYSK